MDKKVEEKDRGSVMSTSLIIGNGISVIAAYFTAKSSWEKETEKIYLYQVLQCFTLAIASIFFQSYTGIVGLLVCAFRNYLAMKQKLDQKATFFCLCMIVIPGIIVNNRGFIGLIVILANILYTFGMYFAKKEIAIKCNIIVNLTLWVIYEFLIIDIPSIIADGIGLGVAIASVIRILRNK